MNNATLEIAAFLATRIKGVTLDLAHRVQKRMAADGLDFSECTRAEFNLAAVRAYRAIA